MIKEEKKTKILTTKAAVIYALGIFGVQFFIGFMNSFQTEFYNKMYSGFDTNIFYASAIIILVAKIISCIFDPIIGGIIDKSTSDKGKMRPWVFRSIFPLAVLTLLVFIYIPFDEIGGVKGKLLLYGYITLTTVLWNIAMSFADIPSSGMLSLLTPLTEERDMAAGLANLTKSMALGGTGVVVTVVMIILNLIKGEGNYPDSLYYFCTAVLIFIIGVPLVLLMYFTNKETVQSTNASGQFSFKEIFAELKRNKQILLVFLIYMLGFARGLSVMVCVQANGAIVGKVELFGRIFDTTADATWLPGLFGAVTGILGISLIPKINQKFGTKKTYIAFSVASFVVAAICCIFYWVLPEGHVIRTNPLYGLVYIMITQILMAFCAAANTYIPLIMTADIVEYEFERTGERKEGINYAVLSLAIKLSNAFAVFFGLLLIAVSGYTQVMYESGFIPARTQNIMIFDYLGVVGISSLLSMIPMFFYKVERKK